MITRRGSRHAVLMFLAALSVSGCEGWDEVGRAPRAEFICGSAERSDQLRAVKAGYMGPLLEGGDVTSVWICRAAEVCAPAVSTMDKVPLHFQWQDDGRLKIVTSARLTRHHHLRETFGEQAPELIVDRVNGAASEKERLRRFTGSGPVIAGTNVQCPDAPEAITSVAFRPDAAGD